MDRQTSGIWRVQYSKFFIFGLFFFVNFWTLGISGCGCWELPDSTEVCSVGALWSARRTSHPSAQRWKTFPWRNTKAPSLVIPPWGHGVTRGSAAPPRPPCRVWAPLNLSCARKASGGGREGLPAPAVGLQSLQKVWRGWQPRGRAGARAQPLAHGSCRGQTWDLALLPRAPQELSRCRALI